MVNIRSASTKFLKVNALGFRTALKNGFDPHAPLTVISIIFLFIFSVVLLAAGGREEHQRPVSEDLLHRVEVSEAGAGALLLGFVVDGLERLPAVLDLVAGARETGLPVPRAHLPEDQAVAVLPSVGVAVDVHLLQSLQEQIRLLLAPEVRASSA